MTQLICEAAARAKKIAEPTILLRVTLPIPVVLHIGRAILARANEGGASRGTIGKVLDSTKGGTTYLAFVVIFFWTLEARFRRR